MGYLERVPALFGTHQPQGESMPRSLAILLSCGLLLLGSLAFAGAASAADIGPTTTCTNGVPDTAGLGVICEITIVNTITPTGGSAVVSVRECHGAANDAEADCSASVADVLLTEPVSAVNQCNNALNGAAARWNAASTSSTTSLASIRRQ